MASLVERLEADYKTAMKARERLRIDTLRLIKAGMERVAIEKRKETLDDQEVLQVIRQQAKQRRETIESVRKTSRDDILNQATAELVLLNAYLPEQLSKDALRGLIDEALKSVGSSQGQIMKYVMSKAAGAADGKTVNQLVAERLKKAPGGS